MLVYPFDPQCRLDSNWIPKETLSAFPSKSTRTLVPLHAPFFQKDCVVRKGTRELIEGTDFYFSIEHKVASHATARRVFGGITIIRDELIPPFTIEYHPQGGTFEATADQIKKYLDTKPDVWESDWGKLINSQYYPPVKILYDPEEFVSEPAIIEACHAIRDAITAKDESTELRYGLYAKRISMLRKDIERLNIDEHVNQKGNTHGTKPSDVGVLSRHETAVNSKRIAGKDKEQFIAYILTLMDSLEVQLQDKFKNGEDMLLDSKLLLNGGTLVLGESTTLSMDDEGISHIGDNALTLVADKDCTRPGTKVRVVGGGNELTVSSTGNVEDNRSLRVNEVEVVHEGTIKSYAQGILNAGNLTVTTADTDTVQLIGGGSLASPMEAIIKSETATETVRGKVKVVQEGSHGFPCPGYSGPNFYIRHLTGNKYFALRNGADDLEHDVFISNVTTDPFTHQPTADRFRPANLPNTAIPTFVRHGTDDVLWLDTTDGGFILLTGGNPDYNTWRCLKVTNTDINPGYYAAPFLAGGKVYLVVSVLGGNSYVNMWEAPVPSSGNTITFTARTLTGTNNNNTAQNSTTFKLFDKMVGQKGDQKCYVYNDDGYYDSISISHAGDQIDYVQSGTQVRICHNGFHYMRNNGDSANSRLCCSYLIDLVTGRIIPDAPGNYPLRMARGGLNITSRHPLASNSGNYSINGKRTNGKIFGYDTYGIYAQPCIQQVESTFSGSELDNIRWNNQLYNRVGRLSYFGLYGTVLHSGIRGAQPYGKDRMFAVCMDGTRVDFRYDPFGTYGPNQSGYGPTNDRVAIDYNLHRQLRKMVWCTDGDSTVARGTWLFKHSLSGYSSYDDRDLGTPVSITDEYYEQVKREATTRFAIDFTGDIVETALTLMVHRFEGAHQLGYLQVIRKVPGSSVGQNNCHHYVFIIYPDRSVGEIKQVTLGSLLYSGNNNGTAVSFVQNDERVWNSGCFIHRLEDGGLVTCITGTRLTFVGDSQIPAVSFVDNAKGENQLKIFMQYNSPNGRGMIATRELGFGFTKLSGSGEGLYLSSYGKTVSDIVANYNGNTPTDHILALSRSDAGDNVAISQFGANQLKRKVDSLISPYRQVQGMDLTQDRVITRAMLPDAAKIPNQRDATYPAQPTHTQSLELCSPINHTHTAADFTLALATTSKRGASKAGAIDNFDTEAVSVRVVGDMVNMVDELVSRPHTLSKLDPELIIDYEV